VKCEIETSEINQKTLALKHRVSLHSQLHSQPHLKKYCPL
jgi:hypothetical protein